MYVRVGVWAGCHPEKSPPVRKADVLGLNIARGTVHQYLYIYLRMGDLLHVYVFGCMRKVFHALVTVWLSFLTLQG